MSGLVSTPAAAVESAAPAPVDPTAGSDDAPAAEAPSSPFGSIAEVREALGLSDDDGDTTDKPDAADKPKPAKVEAKKDAAAGDEDPDAAAILAINKRSAAHRKARIEKARAAEAASAAASKPTEVAAKPVETPKVDAAKPEPSKLTTPEAEAAKAAKEVRDLIAKLAGDDQEAAAAAEDPTAKQAAERKTLVDSIKAQIDTIAAAAKESAKEEAKALKAEVDGLKTQLGAIESTRIVREHIEARVEPLVAELPTLMGKRNAIAIIHEAAGKFFDAYKKFPDVAELARRIEASLAASSSEKPEKNEKRPQTRKTVSNQLGSPPAARSGPDTRTAEQAEADFYARFGLDH